MRLGVTTAVEHRQKPRGTIAMGAGRPSSAQNLYD